MADEVTTVSEEVVVADEEVVVDEEVVDTEEETEEVDDTFNPDDMEFEEDTNFNGFDLSAYADKVDFGDDKIAEAIEQETAKLQELGYTQEQVEHIADLVLMRASEKDSKGKQDTKPTLTKAEIQANLNKHLSKTEKRHYKSTVKFVSDTIKGTELEKYKQDIVTNPFLVKFMTAVNKPTTTTKTKTKAKATKTTPRQQVSVADAMAKYVEWMGNTPNRTSEDRKTYLTGMINKAGNKAELQEAFKSYL